VPKKHRVRPSTLTALALALTVAAIVAPVGASATPHRSDPAIADTAPSPFSVLRPVWDLASSWIDPVLRVVFAGDGEVPPEDPDDPFGGSGGDPGGGTGAVDPNG
jgi:hypothetical protein